MDADTAELCEKRRAARIQFIANSNSRTHKERYEKLNKDVKAAVKKVKQDNLEKIVCSLEQDFINNNSKNLFKTVREPEG